MSVWKKISNFWNGLPTGGKVVVGAVATYGTYKGVKYLRSRNRFVPLPNGGTGIPVTGYDGNGQPVSWSPVGLVDELYSAMSGLGTFTGTKDAVWTKIIQLPTNDMLTATYNSFNQDKRAGGETLTQWIDNEYYYDYFSGVKDDVLAKLRGAGLT